MSKHMQNNTGTVPNANEIEFFHECAKQRMRIMLNRSVAKPTPHSILLAQNLKLNPRQSILDIGTGTGFLGIVAVACYGAKHAVCTDIDPQAVKLASQNVTALGLEKLIACFESDLYDKIGDSRFDLIVSNPPQAPLPPEEAHIFVDPLIHTGNFGGKDGLDIVRLILTEASRHLNENGVVQLGLHEYLGIERITEVAQSAGFHSEKTATVEAEMSPLTQMLQDFICNTLNYEFPKTDDGTRHVRISVFTFSRIHSPAL